MVIVYDFKIPADAFDKLKFEKDEDLFAYCFKKRLSDYGYTDYPYATAKNFDIDVKILKKSLDLRQKEPKNVFKALLKIRSENIGYISYGKHGDKNKETIKGNGGNLNGFKADLDGIFIRFLDKAGIKARKADAGEESLFCETGQDILDGIANAAKIIKTVKYNKPKILITGTGPAGIFAAVYLLENGIKPVLIEKGKRVEDRISDVENLFNKGKFDKKSNVVFGEGGSGTFSDGKLTTRKNDLFTSYILNFLVRMGANKDILKQHKPHLGSDSLVYILKEIRNYLIENGAEIYFEEELKNFEVGGDGNIESVITDKRTLKTNRLILAAGANSYDTYELLKDKGVYIERKPFAVGFRIEHKREFIDNLFFKGNSAYFGNSGNSRLKLNSVYYNISSKEYGGYSFCMCPGGMVINASAGENLLCINGMSYSGRDMENSNSAIVAAVRPEMLDKTEYRGRYKDGIEVASKEIEIETETEYSSLTGSLSFRKDLEYNAFAAGGGNFAAPYQYTLDYIEDVLGGKKNKMKLSGIGVSYNIPAPSYKPSTANFKLSKLLPDFLNFSIAGSLMEFEKKYKGFAANSILTGIETGTSSALRIKRNIDFESVSLKGLYPCGEGSGYSGGIITSAIDGIRCAKAVIAKNTA